jgi:hypothetical protein
MDLYQQGAGGMTQPSGRNSQDEPLGPGARQRQPRRRELEGGRRCPSLV